MNLLKGLCAKQKKSKGIAFRIASFLIFSVFIFNVAVSIHFENTLIPKANRSQDIQISFSSKALAADDISNYGVGAWIKEKFRVAGKFYSKKGAEIKKIVTDKASEGFLLAFKIIIYYTSQFFQKITVAAAGLIDLSLDQELMRNSFSGPGTYIAWSFVRDFLNLFFILALLFSAFATIFQVEAFHLKKIIVLLVVMALLVNFSFPISLFIIDFSNSAMFYLASFTFGDVKTPSSKLAILTDFAPLVESIMSDKSGVDALVSSMMILVFVFLLCVTLVAFGMNLWIRIIALIFLVIFSPAGFAFAFFPSTKSIANSWWSNLIKYSLMGPILIFTILLALLVFKGTISVTEIEKASKLQGTAEEQEASIIESMISFTVPIVLLWMGLITSQKFGGMASGAAMSFAKNTGNKVRGLAMGAVGGAMGFGLHLANRGLANSKFKFLRRLSPMAWKAARQQRKQRLDQQAIERSSGDVEELMEGISSRASVLLPWVTFSRIGRGGKAAKEASDMMTEKQKTAIHDDYDKRIDAVNGQIESGAISKSVGFARIDQLERDEATEINKLDSSMKSLGQILKRLPGSLLGELILSPSDMDRTDRSYMSERKLIAQKKEAIENTNKTTDYRINQLKNFLKQKDKEGIQAMLESLAASKDLNEVMGALGMQYGEKTTNFSPTLARKFLADMLKKNDIKGEALGKELIKIGEISTDAGLVALAGMGKYDVKDNKFKEGDDASQAMMAVAKFKELESQDIMRRAHRNNFVAQDSNGRAINFNATTKLDVVNKAINEEIASSHTKYIGDRGRADTKKQYIEAYDAGLFSDVKNPNIHEFAKEIKAKLRPAKTSSAAKKPVVNKTHRIKRKVPTP